VYQGHVSESTVRSLLRVFMRAIENKRKRRA
jgi:hypothetical protein